MNNREDSLTELFERIKAKKGDLGLVTFKRIPTNPIAEDQMPCIFMLEGTDTIVDHSSRASSGYPVKRLMEITLEVVVVKTTDIKALMRSLRTVVFTERNSDPAVFNPRLVSDSLAFINENRTEGPTGYGLPNVVGMSLVLDLVYTDGAL